MSDSIENLDAKAWSLRKLVHDAVVAERDPEPVRNVWGPLFDGFRTNPYLDGLVDVLKTTDALCVLNQLVNGEKK
ncbi:hypothetical protein [Streptomyces sp. AC495_CC817]|uniref:hypothetical protein n=1 Tax=Streptomyces sp. AC495_CC817 TaxID=2823900 RepID=UPI001C26DEAF|nr:hypothetical protein [Streptomyces sp. AC495_CC817]